MRHYFAQQQWITSPATIVALPVMALVYVILLALFTSAASAYVTGGNWGKATATYKVYFPENRTSGPFPSSTYDQAVGAANKWSIGAVLLAQHHWYNGGNVSNVDYSVAG